MTVADGMFDWNMLEVLKDASANGTAQIFLDGRGVDVAVSEEVSARCSAVGSIIEIDLETDSWAATINEDEALNASFRHMQESRGWR